MPDVSPSNASAAARSAASRIRLLPDRVANQIAAGEVVERPVAVVKELVENSLDAGATRIEIEFQQGGKRLIRIEDNGCGMSRDDALLCLERHATSKIREAADLTQVMSFGFRGEAIPSIASVSRFTLRTRTADDEEGTEVLVNGGTQLKVNAVGMPVGTCIEVERLFNSVPVRRKFLKADKTEAAHIVQLCRLLAIAHPEVAFTLIEDGRRVFQSPVCPTLRERVGEVFQRSLADELVEVEGKSGEMRLRGLIGKPGSGRSTRGEMLAYVNLRPVDNRTLNYAIIESYHGHLPKGRYPLAFLFLEIPPEVVDVNVHPAKREVRFRDEGRVRRFVMETLMERLDALVREARGMRSSTPPAPADERPLPEAPAATPQNGAPARTAADAGASPPKPAAAPRQQAAPITHKPAVTPQSRPAGDPAREVRARAAQAPAPAPFTKPSSAPERPPVRPEAPLSKAQPPTSADGADEARRDAEPEEDVPPQPKQVEPTRQRAKAQWRFLGGAHGDYALFETSGGIVCLKRRAAQMRVLYEECLQQMQRGQLVAQTLLFPCTFELPPLMADCLEQHMGFFQENGFGVEGFGRHSFRITSMPAWFDGDQCEAFVRDVTALILERGIRPRQDAGLARQTLARMAASRASQVDVPMNEAEMSALVQRLLACENPLADPQGRPTYFELGKPELERRFR